MDNPTIDISDLRIVWLMSMMFVALQIANER